MQITKRKYIQHKGVVELVEAVAVEVSAVVDVDVAV